MSDSENWRRFELLAMPHVDAAYNLARWLTHNDHDAQDVVQEALMRAMRHLSGFRGENARPWMLQIVRNSCFTWLKKNRPAERLHLDDGDDSAHEIAAPAEDEPPSLAMRKADALRVNQAIAALPVAYREVLVLRELEDLSYDDIACIADIPVGTVMSRLSRARDLMRKGLTPTARPTSSAAPHATDQGRPRQERWMAAHGTGAL